MGLAGDHALMIMGVLGYLGILAMAAAEIATNSGDGVGTTARQEMKEWLFLNRVRVFRNQTTIDHAVKATTPVFPDPAYTTTLVFDPAVMTT